MSEPGRATPQHVVLLVEANRTLASLIATVLGREGYAIVVAHTAQEVLELCPEVARIDLVITDVCLPGGSGVQVANRVSELHPEAKTLHLSSIPEEKLREKGVGDQASILLRPPALTDLMSRVNEILWQGKSG